MKKRAFTITILMLTFGLTSYAQAQNRSPIEVLSRTEGASSPKANLDVVRWLEGTWGGTLEGDQQEFIAFAPVAGHLPFFVRAWGPDDRIRFYEIGMYIEVGDTIEWRGKHFSSDLTGWEAQDAYVRRSLLVITDEALYFDGFTLVRDGTDGHLVYFRIPDGERQGEIIIVNQKRVEK